MGEKEIDLNALRSKVQRGDVEKNSLPTNEEAGLPDANTAEQFEELSKEDQLRLMRAKGYDDLGRFKDKHFPKGDPDINKLREQVRNLDEEDEG